MHSTGKSRADSGYDDTGDWLKVGWVCDTGVE